MLMWLPYSIDYKIVSKYLFHLKKIQPGKLHEAFILVVWPSDYLV